MYIAKSKNSDSMCGLSSGHDNSALEGDDMCDYHGVRYKYKYKYNVLTAKEKLLPGIGYV